MSGEKRTDLWLARVVKESGYGYVTEVELLDGPHSDDQGVANAAHLMERIFSDSGPFAMVTVQSVPDAKPDVNEAAAETCRGLVEWGRSRRV